MQKSHRGGGRSGVGSESLSIDCDLAKLDARGAAVEQWNDVPKVSTDLPGSAAAIRKHVEQLAGELKTKQP